MTVEEELLIALKSNNLITDEGFDQVQTMNFQRAARTDKGVSALRQIISLLLRKLFCIKYIFFYIRILKWFQIFGILRFLSFTH